VEEKMGVKIPFPIIADLDKEVSLAYSMIHPSESKTETVRCVFIIDPNQIIRTILYYPLTTGRNMDGIIRIVDALQTTDVHHVATPANWRPGDKVIVPAPNTQEMAEERLKEGYECKGLVSLSEGGLVRIGGVLWHASVLMVNPLSQAPRYYVLSSQGQGLPKKSPRLLAFPCIGSGARSVNSLRLD
jgi:hypothetical protein